MGRRGGLLYARRMTDPAAEWLVPAVAALGGAAAATLTGWAARRRGTAPPTPEPGANPGAEAERARLDRRLAEVNRMTGGLAHEIKNPLSTIGLNVQLLREDLDAIAAGLDPGGPEAGALARVQRRLDGVHREATRLRDILDDFLRFAGRIRLDLGPIDLDATVEELTDFFTPEAASKGVRLRLDLEAGEGPVRADAGLLKQALLNLLMNAVQAMSGAGGEGGELTVRTTSGSGSGPGSGPGGPSRTIEVVDTGPGIPADRLEKVFEPYHTGRRGGTGLGLPTARRLVELHGGSLTVDSEPGAGSTFRISLPDAGPPAPAAEPPEPVR